ncbi:unnamed protein product [Mycena citricolor]|uniref:SAP domain-containing protein n=1 Tax=Mycena citricolor TaxID=2018698 RepID=A0AAD2K3W9_9AGAR|nr:unnamed protein product [Mycena citricolor]
MYDDDPESNDDDDDNDIPYTPQPHLPTDPIFVPPAAPNPPTTPGSTAMTPAQFYYDPVLIQEILRLESRCRALEAHAALLEDHVIELRQKVNAKENRPTKRPKLNVEARCLTSDEGRKLAAEAEAERMAKEKEKGDRAKVNKEKEDAAQKRREERDPEEPFNGMLQGRSKPELVDVTYDLGLDCAGTKQMLTDRINEHFNVNPLKRKSDKYVGLFERVARAPAAPVQPPSEPVKC